jgi:ankyrin repeat protein
LEGAPAVTKDLLDQGADVNATHNGTTPLVQSAISGHEAVTAVLLKMHDIDVNLRNHAGQTALWCAANSGHSAIVGRLLEKDDINTECRDESGQTPLVTAVVEGHIEVVKLLLAKGADVNARGGLYNLPPIFWAIQLKTTEIALLLISQESFDSTLQDRYDRTALERAQELDLPSVVTSLLQKRADDSITDASRQTPINRASVKGANDATDDSRKRPVIGFIPSMDSELGLGRGSAGRDDQLVRTSCAVIVLSGFFFFLLFNVHSCYPLF